MKKNKVPDFKKQSVHHILKYTENCSPKLKRFESTKEMGKFMDSFNKEHPDSEAEDTGYWLDFAIVGVIGQVHFFTEGLALE